MNQIDKQFLDNNQMRQKEIGAFVSIRYCVMSAINRTGDHSMNEYANLLQLAIDCVRDEIRLLEQPSVEVAYLIPNEAGIIEWPSDMIDYLKIGIPTTNGQLYNLTVNDNMLLNRAQKCGVDIRKVVKGNTIPPITDGYTYIDHFRGTQYVSGLYGIGGGFNQAYYRVDPKMRQIQFDGIFHEIVLEYNSTGIRGGTIIPSAAIPVIRDYELWQRIENDPRIGANQKDRKKALFDESLAKFHFVINMFSMQEYLDMCYTYQYQGVKR